MWQQCRLSHKQSQANIFLVTGHRISCLACVITASQWAKYVFIKKKKKKKANSWVKVYPQLRSGLDADSIIMSASLSNPTAEVHWQFLMKDVEDKAGFIVCPKQAAALVRNCILCRRRFGVRVDGQKGGSLCLLFSLNLAVTMPAARSPRQTFLHGILNISSRIKEEWCMCMCVDGGLGGRGGDTATKRWNSK